MLESVLLAVVLPVDDTLVAVLDSVLPGVVLETVVVGVVGPV